MSEEQDPLFKLLVRRSRGEGRATALLDDISTQLGLAGSTDRVLTAVALMKTGVSPESISSLISWSEFEQFSAGLLKASGYSVRTNIVLTNPRRQIDILAESSVLALSVDCKHWGRGFSPSALEKAAESQIERTSLLKQKLGLGIPILPAILTLLDEPTRLVRGVPVVPVFALRDFLSSVNRFEEGLVII